MAKRTKRARGDDEEPTAAGATNPHDAAIDALMALLAERSYGEIGLDDIAGKAGLPLAGLRAEYRGKMAILAAFSDRIDQMVLDAGPAEGEGERDRLFDVLMRRFDALGPYRAALKSLTRSAQVNPAIACAAGFISDRSMTWMLAAAQVRHSGVRGRIARSGAGLVFAEAMATWLAGDDPDNEKTMAALDGALRRGERVMGYIGDACDFIATFGRRARNMAGRGENTGTEATP